MNALFVASGVDLGMLCCQFDSEPWILTSFCKEVLVDLLSNDDASIAVQFLSSVANELACIAKEAKDPNANDYREITRIKVGELIKELKQVKLGMLDSCCAELA